ncbi:MAG TPA: single-stranded-DNA-specific exonuclease RecJ [Verrucomicrobiae bacterium]|nr:single-stranded-DNA-specific exonuclease RecJ [Verrucomicrobiae bacterium]
MSNRDAESIIVELLEARGIARKEQAVFRSPNFERDTHSPWGLPGMDVAVGRLVVAKEKNEKVVVFGDYDADGVPATALLLRVFRRLGIENIEGVIPTREQGYGLTLPVVEALLTLKPAIVIAVDNGTVAKEEVAALVKAGVDVIVVDHHEAQEGKIAESALAIINPKMPGSTYPFAELCACGLAWKLACALTEKLGEDVAPLKWELDLVGLSTIADMVPLVGENRVLACFGLKVLQKSRNVGLQALMNVAQVKAGSLSAGDVCFKLAPRINAPSRMHGEILDGSNAALSLLTATDKAEAAKCAEYLHEQNTERQQLVERHIEEAEAQIQKRPHAQVLVAYHDSWSSGVIGLVASRLMDRYRRPAIALAPEGGVVKGSVRSVDGVHALELLDAAAGELERFGGHAKAAGLTLSGSVESFRDALEAYMNELGLTLEELAAKSERVPDAELGMEELGLELAQKLEELQPFGIGFPAPLFLTECEVRNVRRVGAEGKHVSCFLFDGKTQRKAIGFSYRGPELVEGKKYRFRIGLQAEEWQQMVSPVCHIRKVEVV